MLNAIEEAIFPKNVHRNGNAEEEERNHLSQKFHKSAILKKTRSVKSTLSII